MDAFTQARKRKQVLDGIHFQVTKEIYIALVVDEYRAAKASLRAQAEIIPDSQPEMEIDFGETFDCASHAATVLLAQCGMLGQQETGNDGNGS